jgi:MFS family permease
MGRTWGISYKIQAIFSTYDKAIWIRVLGTALTSLTGFMMRPYLALYLHQQMNGSVILPMMIVGLPPFFGMIVNLFGGALSDRYGRKPVMLISLWMQTICMLGYMLAGNAWQYAIVAAFMGLGNAMFQPAANAQVSDVVPVEKRAQVFALLHTALNVGAAAGPLLGLFMFFWNPHAVFLICALSTLFYSFLVLFKVPETKPVTSPATAVQTVKVSSVKGRDKRLFRTREHRLLYLITLCALPVGMLYAQVDSTFPLHLQTHFTNFKSVLATLLAFNGFTVILLQMWIAKRTNAVSSHSVIAVSYTLFGLVAIGYGLSPWFALLIFTEFLFTIGEMLNGPHLQKVISMIAPAEERGWFFSVFGMSWQLSRALGPVIGGIILSAFGGETMFLIVGVVIALAGFFQYSLMRQATAPAKPITVSHTAGQPAAID